MTVDRRGSIATEIVDAEWQMFQAVPSLGGKAPCQFDRMTFRIMRTSQLASWSEAALESYRDDLRDAAAMRRNLLTEKYARMMESTAPRDYARIEHLLLPTDPRALDLIEEILEIVLPWESELLKRYPNILGRGRPIFSIEDTAAKTSIETYLSGELATYSLRTLELCLANVMQQRIDGVNGSEVTLLHTMRQYGFESLEAAEQRLAQSA